MIDHLSNARRRQISQQIGGDAVHFAKRRVVRIAGAEVRLEVAPTGEHAFNITLVGEGRDRATPIEVVSSNRTSSTVNTGALAEKSRR